MFCSLSGKPCIDPVVARPSGLIFDRSAIVHHLKSQGPTCPISNTPLSADDDLISISVTATAASKGAGPGNGNGPVVLPRDAKLATSIPGLLHAFQMEWDATVVETHRLKVQNAQLRQQLSHALYQNDAACRTVARLLAEKESLAAQMAQLKRHVRSGDPMPATPAATKQKQVTAEPTAPEGGDAMDVDQAPPVAVAQLAEPVLAAFADTAARLAATRKKRKTSSTATPDLMSTAFAPSPVLDISHSGIAALAAPPTVTNAEPTLLAARSAHRGALVLDLVKGASSTFPAPLKQSNVAAIAVVDEVEMVVAACVRDRIVLATPAAVLLDVSADFGTLAKDHAAHLAVHPSGQFVALTSASGALAMFQVTLAPTAQLTKLYQVSIPVAKAGVISHVAFHPDGNLLAIVTAQMGVLVYTATTGTEAVTPLVSDDMLAAGHVSALRFLENGFFLAVAAGERTFIWDLRKVSVTSILESSGDQVSAVAGDFTGGYVAVGHKSGKVSVWVYASKAWSLVVDKAQVLGEGQAISGMVWGADSRGLVVVGAESKRVVRFGAE